MVDANDRALIRKLVIYMAIFSYKTQEVTNEPAFDVVAKYSIDGEEIPLSWLKSIFNPAYLRSTSTIASVCANAITAGEYGSMLECWIAIGIPAGVSPGSYYDEGVFLENNPEIAEYIRGKVPTTVQSSYTALYNSGLEYYLYKAVTTGTFPAGGTKTVISTEGTYSLDCCGVGVIANTISGDVIVKDGGGCAVVKVVPSSEVVTVTSLALTDVQYLTIDSSSYDVTISELTNTGTLLTAVTMTGSNAVTIGSTTELTINPPLSVSSYEGGTITVSYADTVTGSMSIALKDVSYGTASETELVLTASKVTTLNIASTVSTTGDVNECSISDLTALTTMVITGSAGLILAIGAEMDTITSVSASVASTIVFSSAAVGGDTALTATFGADYSSLGLVAVSLNSGNAVTFTGTHNTFGAPWSTLIAITSASSIDAYTPAAVATVWVVDAIATGTLDLSVWSSATGVLITVAPSAAGTISKMPSASTVQVSSNTSPLSWTAVPVFSATTSDSVLTYSIDCASNTDTAVAEYFKTINFGTVNVDVCDAQTSSVALDITDASGISLKTLTLSSKALLSLTMSSCAVLTTVDGTSTGGLTFDIGTSSAVTSVKGASTAANTITGPSTGTVAVAITGGTDEDTFSTGSGATGTISFDLGSDSVTDIVKYIDAAALTVKISNFKPGTNGDVLKLEYDVVLDGITGAKLANGDCAILIAAPGSVVLQSGNSYAGLAATTNIFVYTGAAMALPAYTDLSAMKVNTACSAAGVIPFVYKNIDGNVHMALMKYSIDTAVAGPADVQDIITFSGDTDVGVFASANFGFIQ